MLIWPRRTPHGVRGLKYLAEGLIFLAFSVSHPSRGAWIEIVGKQEEPHAVRRRTPHGVRGLKYKWEFL